MLQVPLTRRLTKSCDNVGELSPEILHTQRGKGGHTGRSRAPLAHPVWPPISYLSWRCSGASSPTLSTTASIIWHHSLDSFFSFQLWDSILQSILNTSNRFSL